MWKQAVLSYIFIAFGIFLPSATQSGVEKLDGRNDLDTNVKEFEAVHWTGTGLGNPPSQEKKDLETEQLEREILGPLRRQGAALPASVDLTTIGRVSPSKLQGYCGSCAAFAAASTIESCIHKVTGNLPDVSEQHLMDCAYLIDQGVNTCRGGAAEFYFKWMHVDNKGGIANERDYPYAVSDGGPAFENYTKASPAQCDPSIRNANFGAVVTNSYYERDAREEDIMLLLAAGHAVATTMKVTGGFTKYRTGVYNESKCTNHRDPGKHDSINHAVAVVGYGEEGGVKYWKIKNTYFDWGENGFGKILRGVGHCAICMEYAVPICAPSPFQVTPEPAPIETKKEFGIDYSMKTVKSCKNQKLKTSFLVSPVAFTSPNYPGNYGNNEGCDWTITVPDGEKIYLRFDTFDTELDYDEVTIYDGEDTGSPVLKVVDGPNIPESVESRGNKMHVTFTSNGRDTRKGFKASARTFN